MDVHRMETLIALPDFLQNINKLDVHGTNFRLWLLDIQVHTELLLQKTNIFDSDAVVLSPFEDEVFKYLIYSSVDVALRADVYEASSAAEALRDICSAYDRSHFRLSGSQSPLSGSGDSILSESSLPQDGFRSLGAFVNAGQPQDDWDSLSTLLWDDEPVLDSGATQGMASAVDDSEHAEVPSTLRPDMAQKRNIILAIPDFVNNIKKLDPQGTNFSQWFLDIRVHAKLLLRKKNVLELSDLTPFENQVLKYLIYSTVDNAFRADVHKTRGASEALRALHYSYNKSTRTLHVKLFDQLLKLEYPSSGTTLRSHVARFKALVRDLEIAKFSFTRNNIIGILFQLSLKSTDGSENLNRALDNKIIDGAVSFETVVSTAPYYLKSVDQKPKQMADPAAMDKAARAKDRFPANDTLAEMHPTPTDGSFTPEPVPSTNELQTLDPLSVTEEISMYLSNLNDLAPKADPSVHNKDQEIDRLQKLLSETEQASTDKLNKVNQELDQSRSSLSQVQSDLGESTALVTRLRAELDKTEVDVMELSQLYVDRKDEIVGLENKLRMQKQHSDAAESELSRVNKQLKDQLHAAKLSLDHLQQTHLRTQAELSSAQTELGASQSKRHALQFQADFLTMEVDTLRASRSSSTALLEQKLAESKAREVSLQKGHQVLLKRSHDLSAKNSKLTHEKVKSGERLEESQKVVRAREHELVRIREELSIQRQSHEQQKQRLQQEKVSLQQQIGRKQAESIHSKGASVAQAVGSKDQACLLDKGSKHRPTAGKKSHPSSSKNSKKSTNNQSSKSKGSVMKKS